MDLDELVIELTLLERRLTLYEEKYGIPSEDFYAALAIGKLESYDKSDETRADFSRLEGDLRDLVPQEAGLFRVAPNRSTTPPPRSFASSG